MTPGARVAAAIDIIDRWAAGSDGLDRVLAAWGRQNRYAGGGDRRAIADLVYGAVRRLRSALWTVGSPSDDVGPTLPEAPGRPALIGSLRLDGQDPTALFTGDGHAPAPLCPSETAALALSTAPRGVRLDLPDWLLAPDRLGAWPDAVLAPLRARAPLYLRVSRRQAGSSEVAIAALADDGIAAEPGPLAEGCLRVVAGARRVTASRAFAEGLVEIQDAASQAVAEFARAELPETPLVLDLCAGGGGKALALADALPAGARIVAHDIDATRLAELGPRAARAGLEIETRAPGSLADLHGRADLVLVDAPCSGSGAWSRNPDAKWRLSPPALARLTDTQTALLAEAARLVRPAGQVVYATCSLMAVENRTAVAAAPLSCIEDRSWTPLEGGDGFYAARLSLS
ncbi:MAG: RsmB/NOP family class I SAM-dependent RNA methyltransferase [Paracoccaceae bacterium]